MLRRKGINYESIERKDEKWLRRMVREIVCKGPMVRNRKQKN